MDVQEIIKLFIAGGLAGLIGAAATAWKIKHDADREDRKQRIEESSGAATTTKTIADAAGAVVKMQDDQIDELKRETRALQAEVSALNTRMNIEIQNRLRAEARETVLKERVNELDDRLARHGAQYELADQERQRLDSENHAMKSELFKMSVGVQTLTRQLAEANIEPAYKLDVPPIDRTPSGRLGPLGNLGFSA